MKFVLYTHSLVSDWNHGNAHFQRGILRELSARGHEVLALEPAQGWSRINLRREQGQEPFTTFRKRFPELQVRTYDADFDHAAAIEDADVVIVHEWTDGDLVAELGAQRRSGGTFTLLFHDTHHRAVSAQAAMAELMLEHYDAILAFGEALSERYRANGWGRRVFTWHEAADTRLFRPKPQQKREKDLIWIGNWGDEERTRELGTFLIEPARVLGLTGTVHGVRYPEGALQMLKRCRLTYSGWLANADVVSAFARHRATVHIPRRPYVEALPGIPTIRVFEALASGIPLVCAPWADAEGLFRPGEDFLVARDSDQMEACLAAIFQAPDLAASLAKNGLETVLARHTCCHRVDELLEILARVGTIRVRRAVLPEEEAAE
jgi:spore maturation protein CgeB